MLSLNPEIAKLQLFIEVQEHNAEHYKHMAANNPDGSFKYKLAMNGIKAAAFNIARYESDMQAEMERGNK